MFNSTGKIMRVEDFSVLIYLILHVFCGCLCAPARKSSDENAAREWLNSYNVKASEIYNKGTIASWNYDTNLTEYNKNITVSQISVTSIATCINI